MLLSIALNPIHVCHTLSVLLIHLLCVVQIKEKTMKQTIKYVLKICTQYIFNQNIYRIECFTFFESKFIDNFELFSTKKNSFYYSKYNKFLTI